MVSFSAPMIILSLCSQSPELWITVAGSSFSLCDLSDVHQIEAALGIYIPASNFWNVKSYFAPGLYPLPVQLETIRVTRLHDQRSHISTDGRDAERAWIRLGEKEASSSQPTRERASRTSEVCAYGLTRECTALTYIILEQSSPKPYVQVTGISSSSNSTWYICGPASETLYRHLQDQMWAVHSREGGYLVR